jgi:hypothetical protein
LTIGNRLATFAPPHVFKNGNGHRVRWIPNRVKQMLETHSYVGPIVDEATFARTRRVAGTLSAADRSNDKRRRYPWPLSGTMRCYCGYMLIGTICGNARRRHRYYGCRADHGGRMRLVPADALEQQFVALLARLKASPELIERWRKRAATPVSMPTLEKTIRELNADLVDVERRRRRVWELFETDAVRKQDVTERLDALGAQRDNLEQDSPRPVSSWPSPRRRPP